MPEQWERLSDDCFRLVRHPFAALVWWTDDDALWHWIVERRCHTVDGATVGYKFFRLGERIDREMAKALALDELDAHAPREETT